MAKVNVAVKIEDALKEKLQAIAIQKGYGYADMVRYILMDYIERKEAETDEKIN